MKESICGFAGAVPRSFVRNSPLLRAAAGSVLGGGGCCGSNKTLIASAACALTPRSFSIRSSSINVSVRGLLLSEIERKI